MRGNRILETRRARLLRESQTRAEATLWRGLRGRSLGGFKFVRQEPIRPYLATSFAGSKSSSSRSTARRVRPTKNSVMTRTAPSFCAHPATRSRDSSTKMSIATSMACVRRSLRSLMKCVENVSSGSAHHPVSRSPSLPSPRLRGEGHGLGDWPGQPMAAPHPNLLPASGEKALCAWSRSAIRSSGFSMRRCGKLSPVEPDSRNEHALQRLTHKRRDTAARLEKFFTEIGLCGRVAQIGGPASQ